MAKRQKEFGKFVRLILTGEVVEVLNADSTEIEIDYRGKILTMAHYEVSPIPPEEAAAIEKRISG
jgi:hypothetical protein